MFENWQKLDSTEKIFILFLRIFILHEIKQNEKYPYAYLEENMVKKMSESFTDGRKWRIRCRLLKP